MAPPPVLPPRWLHALAVFIGLGAMLYLAAAVAAGSGDTLAALLRLGVATVALGTLAASAGFLVRFARWHWLIGLLGGRVPAPFNLRVYLAGFALTPSPGKLGETLRTALLLHKGVPTAGSLGAFLADRGSDVVGMALLGAVGGALASPRVAVLEALALGLLLCSGLFAALVRRRAAASVTEVTQARWRRIVRWASAPVLAWAGLWTPWRSVAYALLAVAAFGMQAWVLALYVQALGADLSLAECLRIFAVAMLLGAASMVPGGLGATEAALVYQLVAAGMDMAAAVAAAIALRLSTLWFAILLGVIALLSFARRTDA